MRIESELATVMHCSLRIMPPSFRAVSLILAATLCSGDPMTATTPDFTAGWYCGPRVLQNSSESPALARVSQPTGDRHAPEKRRSGKLQTLTLVAAAEGIRRRHCEWSFQKAPIDVSHIATYGPESSRSMITCPRRRLSLMASREAVKLTERGL